jgi:hypothetical protein
MYLFKWGGETLVPRVIEGEVCLIGSIGDLMLISLQLS